MTTEGATPPMPPDPNGEQPKPFYKRWWFIVIAVIFGLGLIGIAGGGEDELPLASESTTISSTLATTTSPADAGTTSSSAQQTTTTTASTTTSTVAPTTTTTTTPASTSTTLSPGPESAFGSGIQVVGEDVQPGTYETGLLGDGVFDGCYWERLSGFSGDFEELIANNNAVVHDVVEIMASDAAFDSGCDAWYELTPLEPPLEVIPQGKWVVGAHIEPGTYQSEGGDACYWARLRGVSGEFDDLITNDLPSGTAIVEISGDDYAFNSSGCGEWMLRG